jgi:hypothetical protein
MMDSAMLHRAGKDIVTPLPSLIAMVRESADGATFWAPVEGNLELPSGTAVSFRTRSWILPGGETFEGIVVVPAEASR